MRATLQEASIDNFASQDFTLRWSGHLIAILTQMSIVCLNKLIIKVFLPSLEDFLKTLPPFCPAKVLCRPVSFPSICQSLDVNEGSYFRQQVVPASEKLCSCPLCACHKAYYLCWVEAGECVWKDLIKVLRDSLGINTYYCCQSYLRTAGGGHFKWKFSVCSQRASSTAARP